MHLSPISEEAGGYGYGSARDDSFFGFLNGCWFVDFPLGNGKLAKVFFFFRTPLPEPVPPIIGTRDGGKAASGTVRTRRNDACIGGELPLLLHVVLPSLLSLVLVLPK